MIFPYPPELVERFAGPITRVEIADGDTGTLQTLALARDSVQNALTDDMLPLWVRDRILSSSASLDPRDARAVFSRCYSFGRKNIGFQPDPLVFGKRSISDYIQSPHYTFFRAGYGDCLAHAIALCLLGVALGHGAKIRTIRMDIRDPERRFSHVYAMLGAPSASQDGTDWVSCDTTSEWWGFDEEPPALALYDPHDMLIADPS